MPHYFGHLITLTIEFIKFPKPLHDFFCFLLVVTVQFEPSYARHPVQALGSLIAEKLRHCLRFATVDMDE